MLTSRLAQEVLKMIAPNSPWAGITSSVGYLASPVAWILPSSLCTGRPTGVAVTFCEGCGGMNSSTPLDTGITHGITAELRLLGRENTE
jgi:hypothetical protein